MKLLKSCLFFFQRAEELGVDRKIIIISYDESNGEPARLIEHLISAKRKGIFSFLDTLNLDEAVSGDLSSIGLKMIVLENEDG